jgi:hypothetical protein
LVAKESPPKYVLRSNVRRWIEANPGKIILLAPVLFAAHILEEAPGYVRWFNSVVAQGISEADFLPSNVVPFAITAVLAAVAAYSRRRVPMLVMLLWIANFMFANAVYHIAATLVLRRYSPGVVTATFLYLPYFVWVLWYLKTRLNVWPVVLAAIVLVGGIPWFRLGYFVVFKGTRS